MVIQWRPEQNTRKYEAAVSTKKRGTSEVKTETSPRIFPVVGYDPVTLYVEELQVKPGLNFGLLKSCYNVVVIVSLENTKVKS